MAQKKEHVWQMEAGQEDSLSAKVNQRSNQFLNCVFNANFALPAFCFKDGAVILDRKNFLK